MSKVIVFDLDETLRSVETTFMNDNARVVLRPKITDLLDKIIDIKKAGVDSVIYTSATSRSVNEHFLDKLPKKYRNIFSQIISRGNFLEPELNTRENYLYRAGENKNVTVLDYDEILFFEDSQTEYKFLLELFDKELDIPYPVPEKSVTFVCMPFYPRMQCDMYALKKLAKESDVLSKPINDYFTLMVNEPGCKIMTDIIDDFISKDNEKGLKNIDIEEFNKYEAELRAKNIEIRKVLSKDEKLRNRYFDLKEEYYAKDRNKDCKELL